MWKRLQPSTCICKPLPVYGAICRYIACNARPGGARPVTRGFQIPGARNKSGDIFYSFYPRRQIRSRPSVHGAFGTIDGLTSQPSGQRAQTIIPLGTISRTMQAILHYSLHAIPDLIRAQPHAARTGMMNGSNV